MNQLTESRKSRIVLQAKTHQQHFKRHLGIDVGELRAIEIETDRPLGTVRGALEAEKFRIWIDETADQPGRGNTVDP